MWAQIINTLLGIFLTCAPDIFGYSKQAANNSHIIGPVIAAFALTAVWEATRNVRWFNIPMGLWLLVAPWILGYQENMAIIIDMITGALVSIFSLVKGKVSQPFGGGWRSLWKNDALHLRESGLANEQ